MLTAELLRKLRKMMFQGYKNDSKKVGFQQGNALKKALSMVKIYMAGLIIQIVRRESQIWSIWSFLAKAVEFPKIAC